MKSIIIYNIIIERVTKNKYLGTTLNQKRDHTAEVNNRIEMARIAFMTRKSFFMNKTSLLYGAEAWSLRNNKVKKI